MQKGLTWTHKLGHGHWINIIYDKECFRSVIHTLDHKSATLPQIVIFTSYMSKDSSYQLSSHSWSHYWDTGICTLNANMQH